MKLFKILILLLSLLLSWNSCNKEEECSGLNCSQLKIGLVNKDNSILTIEISKLVEDLTPVPTEKDPTGHSINLGILVDRINECEAITAEIVCYACIETNPPQSEILIKTDSSGIQIIRIIDILTPANGILKFANCHD